MNQRLYFWKADNTKVLCSIHSHCKNNYWNFRNIKWISWINGYDSITFNQYTDFQSRSRLDFYIVLFTCAYLLSKRGLLKVEPGFVLDLEDATAANRELWLAAWVLEMSPNVIRQIVFLKNKIQTSDSLETVRSPRFAAPWYPDGLKHAFLCLSKHTVGNSKGALL